MDKEHITFMPQESLKMKAKAMENKILEIVMP